MMLELRYDRLRRHRDSIFENLNGNKPLDIFFDREGIAVHPQLLGLGDVVDYTLLHPIAWELNRRGEEVFDLLSILATLPEEGSVELPPELPIEYVPTLDNSVYFGNRKNLLAKFHSSLVLSAWSKLFPEWKPIR
jgi:hypothetical protein